MVLVDIWEGTEPRPEVERFCGMWGIKGPILLDPNPPAVPECSSRSVLLGSCEANPAAAGVPAGLRTTIPGAARGYPPRTVLRPPADH